MAIFIPEKISGIGASAIHIKRELGKLDDAHVVRTPLRRPQWMPDFFVQHSSGGWLALAVCHAPFEALSATLFENDAPEHHAFTRLLHDMAAFFAGEHGTADEPPLKKLVLMWQCSPQQVQHLQQRHASPLGLVLMSRDAFNTKGAALIERALSPLSERQAQALLACCFPESEIPATQTTRRLFRRDNAATLNRFFLDYDQEWASKLDLALPREHAEASQDGACLRLINGVAGSGKTLIAVARARLLADMHPDQQVLLLIPNKPVVEDLIDRLRHSHGPLPDNLRIHTFAAWARQQWCQVFRCQPRCKDSHAVAAVIDRERHAWPVLKQGSEQLAQELDFINDHLITDLAHYLKASRTGRGFGLREKEREAVWALHAAVTQALQPDMAWSAMYRDVCLAPSHRDMTRAHHVLIDEAQFFAPSWFQLVRLGMHPGGSLFLCADPNQGFLKHRLSWKSAGLELAGRTKKLRRSYRTTRALLSAASQVLAHHTQGDPDDYLTPELHDMEAGTPPLLLYADSPQDCTDRLLNEISAARQNGTLRLRDMLVICGDPRKLRTLHQRLAQRLGYRAIWWFRRQETAPPPGGTHDCLRLTSLESATGLEAGVVFLIGMEQLVSAASAAHASQDEEAQAAATEENARKLYMAMTRAGQRLVLLSCEKLAPAIESAFTTASATPMRPGQRTV